MRTNDNNSLVKWRVDIGRVLRLDYLPISVQPYRRCPKWVESRK